MTPISQIGQQWIRRIGQSMRRNPFAGPGTTERIPHALWLFLLDGLLVSTSGSLERFGFLPVFALSGVGRLTSVLLLLHFVREPQKQA